MEALTSDPVSLPPFFGGKLIYFSFIPLRVRGCLGTINHYQFRSPDRMSFSSPILHYAVARLAGVSWLVKIEKKTRHQGGLA